MLKLISDNHPHPMVYLIVAILMQINACVYLYVVDLRIVQYAHLSWDSELGYLMLIPFTALILYSWVLLYLCIRLNVINTQVWTEDSEWSAKAVVWSDKFTSM